VVFIYAFPCEFCGGSLEHSRDEIKAKHCRHRSFRDQ
jgi:hypothetical protein